MTKTMCPKCVGYGCWPDAYTLCAYCEGKGFKLVAWGNEPPPTQEELKKDHQA